MGWDKIGCLLIQQRQKASLTATTVVQEEQLSWLLGKPSGQKISVDRLFLTGDEFKYAPEKRLNVEWAVGSILFYC